MSKAPTAPQSAQMNGAASVPSQQNASHGQTQKSFGRIGIPAIAAATEILKMKKPDTKSQANPYYLRDYD
jgi:hypothetical protein